jgi:hypothetical protein
VGDCDGKGQVTVDELVRMVSSALGTAPVSGCAVGDRNGNGSLSIDELVLAVNRALSGCGEQVVVATIAVTYRATSLFS